MRFSVRVTHWVTEWLSDWVTWLCVLRVTAASGTLRSQMRHRLFTTSTPFPPRSPSGGWDTCPKEAWMSTNVKSQGTVFSSVSVQSGVFPTGFSKPTDFQPGHTSYENQEGGGVINHLIVSAVDVTVNNFLFFHSKFEKGYLNPNLCKPSFHTGLHTIYFHLKRTDKSPFQIMIMCWPYKWSKLLLFL